ncbi:MAG: preprotein translocase subunit SecE [Gammaproteobacteria bacterium]
MMSSKAVKTNRSDKTESKGSTFDRILWIAVVGLFAFGLFLNYYYLPDISVYLRIAGWIGLFAVMLGLSLLTQGGKQALGFAKAARGELRKVVWPARPETVQTTFIVMAVVVLTSLMLWAIDAFFMWAVSWITGQ